MTVVVDTNVVSHIHRDTVIGKGYALELATHDLAISFQTLEELLFGTQKARWGERRRSKLMLDLENYEVIWPVSRLVDICADLRCKAETVGRKLSTADAWIAATALYLNCPIASHDRDFNGIEGLELIRLG